MSDVKWIKIVTDIFDDEKVLLIESMPEADAVIVIWFKLLCLAGKNNNKGVFMLNERIAYTDEMFSTIFRRNINTVRLALKTFADFGMIEIIQNVITIPNWSKHQTLDQIDAKREYQREYMAKRREEQKLLVECKTNSKTNSKTNIESNSKTNVSTIEVDIDKDNKDIDKNKIKNIKTIVDFSEQIQSYTDDSELKIAIENFIDLRKQIKKPVRTAYQLNLLLKDLDKFSDKLAVVNQSIANGYQGFFELKQSYKTNNNNTKDNVFTEIGREKGIW